MSKMKVGIYAGSFNPFHVGHLDVVKQATKVFDKVIVARGINPEKPQSTHPLPVNFLKDMDVDVDDFGGLLSDYIRGLEKNMEYDVTLVRGLRSGADLEYEQNFVAFLRSMEPYVKIVAFYCNPNLRHISSSALRAIQKIAPEEYRKYVITE